MSTLPPDRAEDENRVYQDIRAAKKTSATCQNCGNQGSTSSMTTIRIKGNKGGPVDKSVCPECANEYNEKRNIPSTDPVTKKRKATIRNVVYPTNKGPKKK